MEMSRKWLQRCLQISEAMSGDGNMETDVISRDMIIKALRRGIHCLRNSKEENKLGNTKLKNQRDCQRHWKKDQWPVRERCSSSWPHHYPMQYFISVSIFIYYLSPPLEYDILLYLQNLEECPQHILGLNE